MAGRPTKYTDDLPQQLINYFMVEKTQQLLTKRTKTWYKDGQLKSENEEYKNVPNDLPTFEGFAFQIGVAYETLRDWSSAVVDETADPPVLKHPEFSAAYNVAKALQKAFLVDNGLQGNSPPATTIFVLKNVTDMTDKTIVETDDKNYKEKHDALSQFFDTVRHHAQPGPDDPGPNPPASQDLPQ